ncbi:hypothetical protein HK099_002579 [Clydaea vesicula]|uniref:Uncharacterized protein n=1 Tax=Clydaea vesicula TaxID=447962 RepID=A0AAD5U2I6_9FUNG|nr:hypothetical protein HK099_002579 [Clydaea vesicula]KAJ3390618.1 hypothetical protein HDU92_000371 [Lobulomyces angularis]
MVDNTSGGQDVNKHDAHMGDLINFKASVFGSIVIPLSFLSVWSVIWTTVYHAGVGLTFNAGTTLITVLGTVLSLLLGFRTNSAYDRYWEGRKLWSNLQIQVRNLSRLLTLGIKTNNAEEVLERKRALLLLQAYAISIKHYLRDEYGTDYNDYNGLLCFKVEDERAIPFEIMFQIQGFVYNAKSEDRIDVCHQAQVLGLCSGLVEILTNFERVRNTPIPLAYEIHLRHILFLYLLSLPFQIAASQAWFTIPIVILASFTMLGIESIGGEIENPFGYDLNDLNSDEFCAVIRKEVNFISEREQVYNNIAGWTKLYATVIGAEGEEDFYEESGNLKPSMAKDDGKQGARVSLELARRSAERRHSSELSKRNSARLSESTKSSRPTLQTVEEVKDPVIKVYKN